MKRCLLFELGILVLLAGACNPRALADTVTATGVVTPEPAETSSATPVATRTRRAESEALNPTPDYLMTGTAIAQTVVATVQPRLYASYPSPDGEWRVDIMIYDCAQVQPDSGAHAYEQMNLVRIHEGRETAVDSQLQNCDGVGAYGLGGLYWSPNSRYFYYTYARQSVPDGACGYWARPIKRLDAQAQEVLEVGAGHLSPDKTTLAFWEESEIVLWSVNEGEIGRVEATVSNAFPGEIGWSPDGDSLAYLQTELDCYPFGKTFVTRLRLRPLIQDLLFESESPSFGLLVWDAPFRLRLVDEQGNEWKYNLYTKDLRPAP